MGGFSRSQQSSRAPPPPPVVPQGQIQGEAWAFSWGRRQGSPWCTWVPVRLPRKGPRAPVAGARPGAPAAVWPEPGQGSRVQGGLPEGGASPRGGGRVRWLRAQTWWCSLRSVGPLRFGLCISKRLLCLHSDIAAAQSPCLSPSATSSGDAVRPASVPPPSLPWVLLPAHGGTATFGSASCCGSLVKKKYVLTDFRERKGGQRDKR